MNDITVETIWFKQERTNLSAVSLSVVSGFSAIISFSLIFLCLCEIEKPVNNCKRIVSIKCVITLKLSFVNFSPKFLANLDYS